MNVVAAPRGGGFTLIELLVVVFLIGLLASVAVLALRTDSPGERLEREAGRLYARMDLAREEAVLRARSLGLQVETDGYLFLELAEARWQPLDDDRLFAAHELPDSMRLDAELDGIEIVLASSAQTDGGRSGGEDRLRPQIFFLASGELLPDFSLVLSARDTDTEFMIAPGAERWLDLVEQGR